ncbi:cytochrome oxidase c subunit VIb-domain-containing protein [Cyathus striatus]|nr:cytochrome oxidase c subunit VIb-domain-containing protein [Cyathus striatus]KAF9007376.1 cytochrome oxidase c subunit VIb-domain-containing protein [Cyathus striatus]
MGWFSSSKQDDTVAISRQDRKKCWDSRDVYYACLDGAGVVKAGTEGSACSKQLKEYEKNCAKSWIEYFNQRRIIADAQKDRLARAQEQFNAKR